MRSRKTIKMRAKQRMITNSSNTTREHRERYQTKSKKSGSKRELV